MRLLTIVSVGDPNPVTGESSLVLGIVDVPDDTKIDTHADVALVGEQRDFLLAVTKTAREQLGVNSFASLLARVKRCGLTATELYGLLIESYTPQSRLGVLARHLNSRPSDDSAEAALAVMEIALARHEDHMLQPGTVEKAKLIIRYVRGGASADFKKLVGKDMPEKFIGNSVTSEELGETFGQIAAATRAALRDNPPPARNVIPAMADVKPAGQGPNDIGPRVNKGAAEKAAAQKMAEDGPQVKTPGVARGPQPALTEVK